MVYENDLEHLRNLADDCDAQWRDIHQLLQQLRARYRSPEQRAELEQLERDIRAHRQECYKELYDHVQGLIARGEIRDERTLSSRIRELTMRARPESRRDEITALQREWYNRGELDDLRQTVFYWINKYREQVEAGWDYNEAKAEFLDKAYDAVEKAAQRMGSSSELSKLQAEIKIAIKESDKTPLYTRATQAQYAEIIAELNRQPADYQEDLIDENGLYVDRLPRDDAIAWYQEQAEKFAEQKAGEYLSSARRAYENGRPVIAAHELEQIAALDALLPTAQVYADAQAFQETLQDVTDKINFARQRLLAVQNAPDLETALKYFEEALDPDDGWPAFRAIAEQEKQVNDGREVHDVFSEALRYILRAMESELRKYIELLDQTPPVWMPNQLNEEKIAELRYYLSFESNALSEQYNAPISRVIDRYEQQRQLEPQVNAVMVEAEDHIRRNDFNSAYHVMQYFQSTLENFPDQFYQAKYVWDKITAYLERERIFEMLDARLQAGVLNKPLDGQIEEAKHLIERAEQAKESGIEGIAPREWDERIGHIEDLIRVLEGELLLQNNDLSAALEKFSQVSNGVPGLRAYADQRIEDTRRRLRDDAKLEAAIQEAAQAHDEGRHQEAYDILIVHEDKTDTLHYGAWRELMERVIASLVDELRAKIQANIQRDPDDPAELKMLSEQLEMIDKEAYQVLEEEITAALHVQTARQTLNEARAKKTSGNWRRALMNQRLLPAPDEDIIYEIREQYMAARVVETLKEIDKNEVDEAVTRLERVRGEIDDLRSDYPHNNLAQVALFIVFVRLAELMDTPETARKLLDQARGAYQHYAQDPAENGASPLQDAALIEEYSDRLKLMDDLVQSAETLKKDIKLENELFVWARRLQEWRDVRDRVTYRIVLINGWFGREIVDHWDEILEDLIAERYAAWHRLDLLARKDLLLEQAVVEDLSPHQNGYYEAIDKLYDSSSTIWNEGFSEQMRYIGELLEAGIALIYLIDRKVYRLPLREQFETDNEQVGHVYAAMLDLTARRDVLHNVSILIDEINDKLNAASVTGDFTDVERLNRELQTSEQYREFVQHSQVRQVLQKYDSIRAQYEHYQEIAARIKQVFDAEDWDNLEPLLIQLETEEARTFNGPFMPRVTDDYGKPLSNTNTIRQVAKEKRSQLYDMRDKLSDLVTHANQEPIIAVVGDTIPVIHVPMRLVDYESKVRREIHPRHVRGDYDDAMLELWYVRNGGVRGNHPAQNAALGEMSLERALDFLTQFQQEFPPGNLISHKAHQLNDWIREAQDYVQDQLDEAIRLLDHIKQLKEAFREQEQRFNAIRKDLQDKSLRRHLRPRAERLEDLRRVYHNITGRGYPDHCDPNQNHPLYPLAPEYRSLDTYYRAFEDEIKQKLDECPPPSQS